MVSRLSRPSSLFSTALLAAAFSLPSLQFAHADAPPERASVSFKFLDYRDNRSDYVDPATAALPHGDDGVSGASGGGTGIQAYTLRGMVPFADSWSLATSVTYDSVSGASPTYHTSGLTPMTDSRTALDAQLTRYMSHGSLIIGASHSGESDYVSNSLSLQGNLSTADKNTTFTLGGSYTKDSIDMVNLTIDNSTGFEKVVPVKTGLTDSKTIYAVLGGITRVMTKHDIVQMNVGYSNGQGYYSDPYKLVDNRPRLRNNTTALFRWNHHFSQQFTDGTARLSYRYYSDTYGIRSHTFDLEYVQPLSDGDWEMTPILRYYSQNAADFYIPVVAGENFNLATHPVGTLTYYTEDPRLATFGAMTFGLKVVKRIDEDWTVDLKLEYYEQRPSWSMSSGIDANLDSYNARSIQVGVSRLL